MPDTGLNSRRTKDKNNDCSVCSSLILLSAFVFRFHHGYRQGPNADPLTAPHADVWFEESQDREEITQRVPTYKHFQMAVTQCLLSPS